LGWILEIGVFSLVDRRNRVRIIKGIAIDIIGDIGIGSRDRVSINNISLLYLLLLYVRR
jgi:hypothetical protein